MIRFYPVLPHFRGQCLRLVTLLLLLVAFGSHASDNLHMLPLSLEERVKAAELIVEGEVVAKRSFWDAGRRNIYTSNTIRVYKIFKGEVQLQELELITEGGTVDLERHVFSAALQLHGGQQGVFFLVKEPQLRTTPGNSSFTGRAYGSKQGFIRYDLQQLTASDVFSTYNNIVQDVYSAVTAKTGRNFRILNNNLPLQEALVPPARIQSNMLAASISSFSPAVASAGTNTILNINGSGFGNARGNGSVKFKNGDDGGQTLVEPLESDYKSWTDTRIQVQIPSYGTNGSPAGSGAIQVTTSDGSTATSTASITIEFVYSNVVEEDATKPVPAQPILINQNGIGGYSLRFAPSMLSRPQAQEGFKRAMNNWICNTQVNWRIGSSTTIDKAEKDNVNVILFTQTAVKTLAQTISRYSGCRNTTTNEITWWVDEFDMEINQNIIWQYGPQPPSGNQFDFETVILHELGHAHQLGHVIQPNASVMHYAVAVRSLFRQLIPADINGGRLVIENSFDPAKLARAKLCKKEPIVLNTELINASYSEAGTVELNLTICQAQDVTNLVVERSPDGVTWTAVGETSYKGTGNYIFTDPDPLAGISYYRVRMNSNNTPDPLFSPRVLVVSPEFLNIFTLYPNPSSPATEEVHLEYFVRQDAPMTLQLYDITGRLVQELEHTFTDENVPLTLSVHNLAAGIYFLKWRLTHGTQKGEVKLVKL